MTLQLFKSNGKNNPVQKMKKVIQIKVNSQNILYYNQQGMRKIQLKIAPNRSRLQINRDIKNGHCSIIRDDVLKQNYKKIEQKEEKEEKGIKIQKTPSTKSFTNIRRPSIDSIGGEVPMITKHSALEESGNQKIKQKKVASVHKDSTTSTYEELCPNVNIPIKQFVSMLQRKKLLKYNFSNYIIPSANFISILRYIITRKNSNETYDAVFIKNITKEIDLQQFLALSRPISLDESRKGNKCNIRLHSSVIEISVDGVAEITDQKKRELAKKIGELKDDLKWMQKMKVQLASQINEQKDMIKQALLKQQTLQKEIHHFTLQLFKIKNNIQENQKILQKVDSKKQQIQKFIKKQPNQIVKQASQHHKNLQLDLFQYADFLKYHPLGKRQFETSIYYNEIQRLLNIELKQLNDYLDDEQNMGINEKKGKCMANFLTKMKHQYNLLLNELQHAIDEKTKYIEKYSKKIFLWYENYLTKKEYLQNLKNTFSLEIVKTQELKMVIDCQYDSQISKCKSCAVLKVGISKVYVSLNKIIELYEMGNSFY